MLGNTWATKDAALGTVKDGGALAYDGGGYAAGYIYGFRGDGSNKFWRYDIDAASHQLEDTPADAPQNVKKGGTLVYLNGYVYAFRGDDKTDFWRYDVANDNWECANGTLSPSPANAGDLCAGQRERRRHADHQRCQHLRLPRRHSKKFWRYDTAANTWTGRTRTLPDREVGCALPRIGNYIYATRGDDKRDLLALRHHGERLDAPQGRARHGEGGRRAHYRRHRRLRPTAATARPISGATIRRITSGRRCSPRYKT